MSTIRNLLREVFYQSPRTLRSILINAYGFLLAKRRFGGEFGKFSELFETTQWQSPEDIKEFQMSKLRGIMEIAYQKVPYYRRLFPEYGLTPKDFNNLEDLKKLPILTKQIIQCNFSKLLNEDINKMDVVKGTSSGTTGQKLEFYLPKELAYSIRYSLLYRFYGWAGIKWGDKRVTIGGRFFTKRKPYWIYNRAENQLLLSIHHLSDETVDGYIEKIKRFSPVFIQGHPTGLTFISRKMLELGTSIYVKAVFTTGETLDEQGREIIAKAFCTEVFDSYGSGESVITAFECEKHNGLHEASELGVIEFEEVESGIYKVIGTCLWNDAMPFIRYEMEDLVELSPKNKCTCGRGLPLKIKKVLGRIDDAVFSTNGEVILPVTIRMLTKPLLKSFENYQFRQLDKKEYVLLIKGKVIESRKRKFLKALREVLGDSAKIDVVEIDEIMTEGGKIRNVVNFCKHNIKSNLV